MINLRFPQKSPLLILVVLFALGWGAPPLQALEDPALQEAVRLKNSGDLENAIPALEAFLEKNPGHADAMLHLGTALGWDGQYAAAIQILREASESFPDYTALKMALGRVLAWKGNLAEAESVFESLLEKEPGNQDARIMLARVVSWNNRYDTAKSIYRDVLDRDPEAVDAWVGLGDVSTWEENFREAESHYFQAQALDPESEDIETKLRHVRGKGPWKLATGFHTSTFHRGEREDWMAFYLRADYFLSSQTSFFGQISWEDRFGLTDNHWEGGLYHKATDRLNLRISAGFVEEADFLADGYVEVGGSWTVHFADTSWQTFILELDWKHSEYAVGNAEVFDPGFIQYLNADTWFTGKIFLTRNPNGEWTEGWLARIDHRPRDNVHLYLGYSDGSESFTDNIVDLRRQLESWAAFAGVVWEPSPSTQLRFDYVHEDIRDSVIRNGFHLGLSIRF